MKLKNKILLILSLLLFLICFSSSVFASNPNHEYLVSVKGYNCVFTFNSDTQVYSVVGTYGNKNIDYTYTVANTSDYKIVPFLRESYGTINYCYFKVPVNSNYHAYRLYNFDYFYFWFYCDQDYYYYNGSNLSSISANTHKKIDNSSTYPMCTVYANDSLNENEILFHLPVPVSPLKLEMMGEVIKANNPLVEIIHILPMILVVVVCLVGFRKGLVMLETLLRHS